MGTQCNFTRGSFYIREQIYIYMYVKIPTYVRFVYVNGAFVYRGQRTSLKGVLFDKIELHTLPLMEDFFFFFAIIILSAYIVQP